MTGLVLYTPLRKEGTVSLSHHPPAIIISPSASCILPACRRSCLRRAHSSQTKSQSRRPEPKEKSKSTSAAGCGCARALYWSWSGAVNGGPRVRGDRALARPARRQRRRGCRGGGEEAGLRGDHRPQAEAGAAGGGGVIGRGARGGGGGGGAGGGWPWRRRRPRRGPTVVASSSHHRRRSYDHEEVAEPEQRGHRRRAAGGPREASRAQGTGGGLAARPVVPQEHPGRPVPERQRRRRRRRQVVVAAGVGEGEHGRRAVPAQGGAEDVRQLPGAVQGAPEDVQLLHHRQLRVAGDDDEGDEAGGPSERLRRVRAHVRGQGRRLDARRRRPLGDVRGVVQAPPDHERIGSRRPRTEGDGQVQQQLLSMALQCKRPAGN